MNDELAKDYKLDKIGTQINIKDHTQMHAMRED